MIEFFRRLFDTDFMPHVLCLRTPGLVWLHAVSDASIAIAYFLIPLGLLRLVQKRRDLAFDWLFVLFAVFILSCGATHVLSIVTLWVPVYRFEAVIKLITAVASLVTAGLLIRLIPKIAILPSPRQWSLANAELKAEIDQRKSAETTILLLNADLEKRVDERTRELEDQNLQLQELKSAWDLAHGLIRRLDGSISFWCQGNEELYGWKKEEAVGRVSHQLFATGFPTPLAEVNAELEEKGSWTGELLHTTKSGTRLHVATHWVLQRDQDGVPVSVIEVNNDITDRLRADEASQRLADLVESSDDAIVGSTLDGSVISWNSSAESLFGYSAAEMVGESFSRLVPVDQQLDEDDMLSQIGQGSGARRYETVRIAKDGRHFPVALTISPIRNSQGAVIGTSQILRDISEAKAREEAFRLSEERQRLAVNAGQIGLWFLDVTSQQCSWTQRCKELHGIAVDAAVPDYPQCLALIHADDRESVHSALKAAIRDDSDLAVEYRTRGLDSRIRWIQSRGRAQRSPDGRVTGIHGTVIDLTARRQMEDQLRRVNTELEEFAYAAAHDLQEPLRNVALAADMLKTQRSGVSLKTENGESRLLHIVFDNARRMETMVKDLLAYSRSLDVAEDQLSGANANTVLQKALQNLTSALDENHAIVTSDPLPWVSMHEAHLLQVLQNLIGNAAKYAGIEAPRIHVSARARNEDVLLCVKDNGIGIPPGLHQRAFRMFKRLHAGEVKGSGIGLAVCKRIVEYYGGQIWIESRSGEGATLFFTIPSTTTAQ